MAKLLTFKVTRLLTFKGTRKEMFYFTTHSTYFIFGFIITTGSTEETNATILWATIRLLLRTNFIIGIGHL